MISHSALAGGFLTGKYQRGVDPVKGVDRFAQSRRIQQYQERYLHRDEMFDALDAITTAAEAAGLTPVKINVVVVRGFNEDEVPDFAQLTL